MEADGPITCRGPSRGDWRARSHDPNQDMYAEYALLQSNLPSRGGGGGIPEPVHLPPDASLPSRQMTTPPSPPSGLGGADGRHYHCGAHSLTHTICGARSSRDAAGGRDHSPFGDWGGPPAVFRNTGGRRCLETPGVTGPEPRCSHFHSFQSIAIICSRLSAAKCAAAPLPQAAFARVCRRVRCSASRRVRAGRQASLRARGAWQRRWRAAECRKSVRTFRPALHRFAMCGTWRITQLALRGCAGQRATGAC